MDAHTFSEKTPIWQLTVGEFRELLATAGSPIKEEVTVIDNTSNDIVMGLTGMVQYFGISKTTAQRWKARYPEAITQNGRTIICDTKKMLQLIEKDN